MTVLQKRLALVAVVALALSALDAGIPDSSFAQAASSSSQAVSQPVYEQRDVHDPNGTGKFYMGREIAQVMGPGGIAWLDRPQREEEEHSGNIVEALNLQEGEVVADVGAGSGYYTFRIAPKVGKTGKVLAVDIQDEMIKTIRERAAERKLTNVDVIKGSENDPHLPENGVDLVLMVDVYHELSYPFEVMTKIRKALKPRGRMVFVEYRKEDPKVRIKEVHKMTVEQLEKEMKAVGLMRVQTIETLPLQHIVIFEKSTQQSAFGIQPARLFGLKGDSMVGMASVSRPFFLSRSH